MKNLLTKLFVLFILLIVLDITFGCVMQYLFAKAKGGEVFREKYICEDMKEDVVIFGSSRALHHYDPHILSDSLQLKCFNAGYDGNGIILMYSQYKMMTQRYIPKTIIYDINPDADYYFDGDKHRFLNPVRAYYDKSGIDSIFWDIERMGRVKYVSNLYRYNTIFTQYISAFLAKGNNLNGGWIPKNQKMLKEPQSESNNCKPNLLQIDELKKAYFLKFIEECKRNGTQLVFCISPYYNFCDDYKYDEIRVIAKHYDIPFLNFAASKEFVKNSIYFYDSVHLNRIGATAYTNALASELRRILR